MMFGKEKTCRKCGAVIVGRPKHCPACGAKCRHPIRTVLIVFLCLSVFSAAFGTESNPGDTDQTPEIQDQAQDRPAPSSPDNPEQSAHTHTIAVWTTTLEPTCTQAGKKTGVCSDCGETVTEELPITEHTEGDWTVTTQPTVSEEGERTLLCQTCGTVMRTEAFSISKDEYIKLCQTYTYDEIARYPGDYKGKPAQFKGQVIQVLESTLFGITSCTLRVNVTPNSYGYEDTVYVIYSPPEGAGRILEDDIVMMYGTLDGTTTYQSILGARITIPRFQAAFIDIVE